MVCLLVYSDMCNKGEYRLFMVRGEKNGGGHTTSENSIYSKLHVWITFQARFKNKPITYEAILEHV
jgi:hypothetical protein